MDPLAGKVPNWRRLYYKWKSLRNVPFRRRWFVGYDLEGNTYWEFKTNATGRLRRMVDYRLKPHGLLIGQYSQNEISPRWSSWMRFTRPNPPSLTELVAEEQRKAVMKVLAQQADQRWKNESVLESNNKVMVQMMQSARKRLEDAHSPSEAEDEVKPKSVSSDASPIQNATITPRR